MWRFDVCYCRVASNLRCHDVHVMSLRWHFNEGWLPKWKCHYNDYFIINRGIKGLSKWQPSVLPVMIKRSTRWPVYFINKYASLTKCNLNSLRPGDTYGDRFGSTMAQFMAWSLMAPSHFLNQCWLIIKSFLWHLYEYESNSTINSHKVNPWHIWSLHF